MVGSGLNTVAPPDKSGTRAMTLSQIHLSQPGEPPVPTGNPEAPVSSPSTPPAPDLGPTPTFTIFGSDTAPPRNSSDSLQQREQQVDAYADRVKTQVANIEGGSDAERNVKFQNARTFMTPAGYFSGGLMAGGFDPNAQIKVRFNSYVGLGRPESQTDSTERSYQTWEIAAGVLQHDRPASGGVLNFQSMTIDPADQAKVNDLESLGAKLQSQWKQDVATPMQAPSGTLAARSGKADAYSVRATLQSLQADKNAGANLSPEAHQAIDRTLGTSGQVVIPNVYGYPLAGHAFIPYTPYDGNDEHRPNQGLMMNLNQGTVSEIHGDQDFANWAARNRDDLLQSFNASDRQGGLDAHWPKAGEVLDNLIAGNDTTYEGYKNLVSDQDIPVRKLFNYAGSRGSEYQLKYGNLTSDAGNGIASQFQSVNKKNAAWEDQTEVFGASQRNWKVAKEIWGNTFGFVPLVGNIGNMVFGAHDSLYGMTAQDRIGGNVAAATSSLLLMHELAPGAARFAAAKSLPAMNVSTSLNSVWKFNPKTSEFKFVPPQRVNGRIGYPMSPVQVPQIDLDSPSGVPTNRGQAEHIELDTRSSVTGSTPSGKQPPGDSDPVQTHADRQSETPGLDDSEIQSENRPLIPPRTRRKPVIVPMSRKPAVQSPLAAPSSSANPAEGDLQTAIHRAPSQSSIAEIQDVNPLSTQEEAEFEKRFPGGMDQAESYLKSQALSLNRSPVFLSSNRYLAPQSWSGIPQKDINSLMDRYLSVWDPEPKQADYQTTGEFTSAYNEYNQKIGKYKEGGNFDVQKYWDDLVSDQNTKFKAFVDNQTKRLAIATKVYDDFTANPTQYRVKPDDPYTIRKQLTGPHDGKRDAMYLQREALDFGDNRFYKLDDKHVNELRSSFLALFGRDNSKIETAFLNRKNDLENELYRYGNAGASRDQVEAKKKALQDRFNGDIETAIKNMDLMYKRIAFYGSLGALSISAVSAILWKTIDEIRKST